MITRVAYKTLMAVTGLFLCLYLVVHLLGNSQLFLDDAEAQLQFNWYAKFLSKLIPIKVAAWTTYLAIFAHTLVGLYLMVRNRNSAGTAYAARPQAKNATWFSNYMGMLGIVILVFLTIHMIDFWWPYASGSDIGVDSAGRRDLYGLVETELKKPWKAMLYVVGSLAVGCHLLHGVYSSFRSLGLYHSGYATLMKWAGYLFSIVIGLGFAAIPIYLYFFR